MDEIFQDFYSEDDKSGYSASKILSDSWLSQKATYTALTGYDENDAHEFFQFLAQELHRTTQKHRQDYGYLGYPQIFDAAYRGFKL